MSDWADEIGARIAFAHGNKPSISSAANEIASALRAARADALEEAAGKADYWRKNYRLGETKRVRFDRRDMNSVISGTAQCIAEDIRSLKDKEKAG